MSLTALGMLVLCGALAVSPFGRTVLGGPGAKPILMGANNTTNQPRASRGLEIMSVNRNINPAWIRSAKSHNGKYTTFGPEQVHEMIDKVLEDAAQSVEDLQDRVKELEGRLRLDT